MRVIPPLAITDALLTSSTATEPGAGETAWLAAAAYTVGQRAIRASTHRVYERLVAGTTATAPESDTANWLDVGPTNKWAMFDLLRNSATVVASPLTVVITPAKRINSIAVMGCVADSITVTMTVASTPVYTFTQSMTLRRTLTATQYCFGLFGYKPSTVRFDLPLYTGAVITVTLTRASGNVSCGALVLGTSVYLGLAEYDAVSDALNFSTVTRDAFGNTTLVPRRTVPKTNQTLFAAKESVNQIIDTRTALNAVPAVWSGLDDKTTDGYFEALLILGIYKNFGINLKYPDYAQVTLELEEI